MDNTAPEEVEHAIMLDPHKTSENRIRILTRRTNAVVVRTKKIPVPRSLTGSRIQLMYNREFGERHEPCMENEI